jgi:hypothetical protein
MKLPLNQFSNFWKKQDYLTHNLIIIALFNVNEEKYNYLVNLRSQSLNTQPEELLKSNFFPADRSPN